MVKKMFSIFLSLLLLFSSMGFAVSTHFCGGHAVESVLAFGDEDVDCGMMEMKHQHAEYSGEKAVLGNTICCSSEYSTYTIRDEFSADTETISLNSNFLFAFIYSYLSVHFSENEEYKSYYSYSSPPLILDIPVLNQSFLI